MFNIYYHEKMFTEGHPLLRPRVKAIIDILQHSKYFQARETELFGEEIATLAHTDGLIEKLKVQRGLDGVPIWDATLTNMSSSLSSALEIMQNKRLSFALRSDGGHHASSNSRWDMCYLNHIAICAKYIHKTNPNLRILIIDTDFHHGDGTWEILQNDQNISLLCIHCTDDVRTEDTKENVTDIAVDITISVPEYMNILEKELESRRDMFDIVLYDFGFDIFKLDYGGMRNFEIDDVALVAKKVIDFSLQYSRLGISLQLAGGSNTENASKIYSKLFALLAEELIQLETS